MNSKLIKIIAILMLLFGLIGFFSSFYSYFELHEDKNYLPVTGQVTAIEEQTSLKYGGKLYYSISWKINFNYLIDSQQYSGVEYIEAWDIFSSVCPYKVNELASVYYNPQQPSEAVLVRHIPLSIEDVFGHIIISLVFIFTAYILLFKPDLVSGKSQINTKAWYAQRAPEKKIAFWISAIMLPLGLCLFFLFSSEYAAAWGGFFIIFGSVFFVYGWSKKTRRFRNGNTRY